MFICLALKVVNDMKLYTPRLKEHVPVRSGPGGKVRLLNNPESQSQSVITMLLRAFSSHIFRMCSHCWWDKISWVDQAKIKFKGAYSMASAKILWTSMFLKTAEKFGDFICFIITIPWSALSTIYLWVTKILRLFSLF